MKKLLLVLAMSGCACLAQADTMSFITVLSSPVGSFNKLETADPSLPAYGKAVNFCTQLGNGGVVELKGTQTAVLGRTNVTGGGMYLSSGTTLGKTDQGKFSLNNITLKKGGNITGGRLFANTVAVNNVAAGKAGNLYGNTLTLAGAKTNDLMVADASFIKKSEQKNDIINNPPNMVWSNEYQSDGACSNGSACAKQYLLKSGHGTSAGDCSDATYKINNKSECCPSTPYTDADCWVYTDPCQTYTPTTYTWIKQEERYSGVSWYTFEDPKICSVGGNSVSCPSRAYGLESVERYFAEKASSLSSCSSTVFEGQSCNNAPSCVKVSKSYNLDSYLTYNSGGASLYWNKYTCELEQCDQAPVYLPNGWSW